MEFFLFWFAFIEWNYELDRIVQDSVCEKLQKESIQLDFRELDVCLLVGAAELAEQHN